MGGYNEAKPMKADEPVKEQLKRPPSKNTGEP